MSKKLKHKIANISLYESTLSHYCGKCFLELGFDKTEKELRNRHEPQHAKEPIANCENCKHVCTNNNIDHCHMYEQKIEPPKEPDYVICKRCGGSKFVSAPAMSNTTHTICPKCGGTGYEIEEPCDAPNPESATQTSLPVSDATQYKVGDWVEWRGDQYMVKSAPPQSGDRYNIRSPYDELGCSVYPENITRKLSPYEVVIHIGCLSGTVDDLSYAVDGRFWLIGKATERCPVGMFALLYSEMLDTPTRKIVENLIKAQEEEE